MHGGNLELVAEHWFRRKIIAFLLATSGRDGYECVRCALWQMVDEMLDEGISLSLPSLPDSACLLDRVCLPNLAQIEQLAIKKESLNERIEAADTAIKVHKEKFQITTEQGFTQLSKKHKLNKRQIKQALIKQYARRSEACKALERVEYQLSHMTAGHAYMPCAVPYCSDPSFLYISPREGRRCVISELTTEQQSPPEDKTTPVRAVCIDGLEEIQIGDNNTLLMVSGKMGAAQCKASFLVTTNKSPHFWFTESQEEALKKHKIVLTNNGNASSPIW